MTNDLKLYKCVRSLIKTGDHIGWRGNNIVGKIIRKFTADTINHSELAIRLEYEGLDKRRFDVGALSGGITLHMLSRKLEKYNGNVYWYPLKEEYNELRPKIAFYVLDKIDIKYDYKSLFKNLLGRVSSDADKLFCSEVCNLAWVHAGIYTGFSARGKAPTPDDIDKFKIFRDKIRIL
jgi:hypothetical protein